MVAGLLLGAMVGAATAGRLSDRLGRRKVILAAAVIFTVGALGAALAPTVGVLVAARVVLGVAVGAAALIVPLYLSEVAPTSIRGAVTSLNQLMVVDRDPDRVHRQRRAGLVGELAADARAGGDPVRGPVRGHVEHARDPALADPARARGRRARGAGADPRGVRDRRGDPADPRGRGGRVRRRGPARGVRAVGAAGAAGGHRPGRVPAAGRDQHDHLLRPHHADQRRLRRLGRHLRQPGHRRAQRGRHRRGRPDRRPRGPQATAAGGPGRDGHEPDRAGAVEPADGRAQLGGRPAGHRHAGLPGRLHRLLRRHLGARWCGSCSPRCCR